MNYVISDDQSNIIIIIIGNVDNAEKENKINL